MIKLEVPEAFAFDYLSILEIKASMDLGNTYKDNQSINCYLQIESELGSDLIREILDSDEYRKLSYTNAAMFDAVEKARYGKDGEINPKEWDILNMNRHKAKQDLQRKFFNNELTETKT